GTTLQVSGTYTEDGGSKLKTSIDSATSFGALTVSGSATLAGTLTIDRLGSFMPADGTTFGILAAGSRFGTWSKATGAVISGATYFRPSYSATAGSLVVTTATLSRTPASGPPGTAVTLTGGGFPANSTVSLSFKDSGGKTTA